MRYFVIGDDGQKYGPADVATLNNWIAEGRLLPTQQLEEEASGSRTAAQAVEGLNFPLKAAEQFAPGQPYQQHYARPEMMYGDGGAKDLKSAWICGAFSLVCCGLIGAIIGAYGIRYANKAAAQGNPNAMPAKVLNICGVVISVVSSIGWVTFSIMQAKK